MPQEARKQDFLFDAALSPTCRAITHRLTRLAGPGNCLFINHLHVGILAIDVLKIIKRYKTKREVILDYFSLLKHQV